MTRGAHRGAWLLLLLLGLGGCTTRPDPGLARLCRIALVATVDDPAALTILRQSALPGDAEPGVRIDLGHVVGDPFNRPRFAECRFSSDDGRLRLIGFTSDHGTLSEASLVMMQRFWLESPESADADPQPIEGTADLPVMPEWAVYLLQHLLNALPTMALYATLAGAYALVYGLVGRINLSFGAMAAVGGAAGLTAAGFVSASGTIALVIVVFLGALWGAVLHGVVLAEAVFRPLRRSTIQQGLVATVGLAIALNEYLRLAQGPLPHWVPPLAAMPLPVARSGSLVATVTPLALGIAVLFAAAAGLILLVMNRTQFGRDWRAMADDSKAASLLGVDPAEVFRRSFALASALAGMAGATVVLVYGNFGPTLGTALGLKGLLAAVLGGIGSVRGALLGGVAISLVEALWSAYGPIEQRDLVLFVALSVLLILRPGGFFGDREGVPRLV